MRVLIPWMLVAGAAWSQTAPDGEVWEPAREMTINVDTAQGKNQSRSLGLALLGSALLPGSGEAYLREAGGARGFLLAEVGFWAGLFFAWQSKDGYLQSARNLASEFAGAPASGKSERYLETLASYRSYYEREHRQDSYELAQVISGDRDGNYPIRPEDSWDFGSSNTPSNTRNWKEFQSTMRYYRGAKVAVSFALGAMAMNRLASLAHTLRVYRRTSGKGLSYHFNPELGPETSGMRLSVAF